MARLEERLEEARISSAARTIGRLQLASLVPQSSGDGLVAFDVFKLRDRVVGEYRDYVESFVHIYDQRIEEFVRDKL